MKPVLFGLLILLLAGCYENPELAKQTIPQDVREWTYKGRTYLIFSGANGALFVFDITEPGPTQPEK